MTSEEYDLFCQPLVNQPGEVWEYGVNIDWVGRLIERITNLSLEEYFQKRIFSPLGLSRISFFPSVEMKENLAALHQRHKDGEIELRDGGHILHRPLVATSPEAKKSIVNAGGHGLFCVPSEFTGMLVPHSPNGHILDIDAC